MILQKMELVMRCCKGASAGKPPPPPKPPSPTDAAQNKIVRQADQRRKKAANYQSTILTGGLGVQSSKKSLLGE